MNNEFKLEYDIEKLADNLHKLEYDNKVLSYNLNQLKIFCDKQVNLNNSINIWLKDLKKDNERLHAILDSKKNNLQ